jgi:hypothetical protein
VIIGNNRTIEIERFVPRAQIDPRYHDTPYYIAPRDQVGQEAFAVIREAMRGKEMVGMGRVILSKRERPIIIEPLGNVLRGMVVAVELSAYRRPDEVGAIGVKAVLHQQVDLPEIDIAEIDRDLLAIRRLWPQLVDFTSHHPSSNHPTGRYLRLRGRKRGGPATRSSRTNLTAQQPGIVLRAPAAQASS